MKGNFKRAIAILCALTMIVGSIWIGNSENVKASDSHEWTIYSPETPVQLASNGDIYWLKQDLNFNFAAAGTVDFNNLALCMKVNIADAGTLAIMQECYVELAQNKPDEAEIQWSLKEKELKVGENEIYLNFYDGDNQTNVLDTYLDLAKTINCFRIFEVFTGDSVKAENATLTELKLVDVTEAGVEFGETDTYLQLENAITTAPETIEASVKWTGSEEQTEWTLVAADRFESQLKKSMGTTSAGEKPGAGISYVNVEIDYSQIGTASSYITGKPTNGNVIFSAPDFGKYREKDLALAFWYYTETAGTLPKGQIELASNATVGDTNEINWNAATIAVNAGWNYIELPLDKFNHDENSPFDLNKLVRCRWYSEKEDTKYNFKVTEMKIVVLKEQTEWTLASAGNDFGDAAVNDGIDGPGTDWNIAEMSPETGTQVHFAKKFTTPELGDYTQNNLALTFWYYSYDESSTKLPAGQIELSSKITNSGTYDSYEMTWQPEVITVDPGWNYIELPLACYCAKTAFDLANIEYVRWYTNNVSGEWKYKLSDIRLVVHDKNVISGQTLVSATKEMWKSWLNGNVQATYINAKVKTTSDAAIFTRSFDASSFGLADCSIDDLAVAFWYYSTDGSAMPLGTGGLELTSSGTCDQQELFWQLTDTNHVKVQKGWNYIVLPLNKATDNPGTGNVSFQLENMNYMRLYTSQAIASEWDFLISAIELIRLPLEEGTVTVTEVTDEAALEGEMIFSNVNNGAEDSAYALFITEDGYPALLWGSTQYTLAYEIPTGEWIDIAVVRETDKKIKFYINGVLRGTSDVAEEDDLGGFQTAHCIGADGAGGNFMHGSIADIRLWSDARTAGEVEGNRVSKMYHTESGLTSTTEGLIGNWFLYGNSEYILKTMPDVCGNTAVYRGTRAEDWYDYKISDYDFLWSDRNGNNAYDSGEENYWSLVFIPDIQNLTNGIKEFQDTWYDMADWIAANYETENIQHVIGAGDSTWNNLDRQYRVAMAGIERFDQLVPFTNLIGNHDYQWGLNYRDSSQFQKYFGADYITNTSNKLGALISDGTYKWGYYEDPGVEGSSNVKTTTENSYYRFTVNNTPWMILQMEYHPRTSAIEWADGILKQYPNDNVILATHGYLGGTGGYIGEGMTYIDAGTQGDGADYNSSTEAIWSALKDNSNIKFILCGHSSSETGSIVVREETNEEGRTVKALMINAQDLDAVEGKADTGYYTKRSLGMLSILRFSEDGQEVAVQYYCPSDDKSFNPLDTADSTERSTKDVTIAYGVEPYIVAYDSATAGTAPDAATIPDGYVFAGWYTDSDCTKVLMGKSNGNVYAKYVHKDVLNVKAQVRLDKNTGTVPTDETDIRFVTTVDSLAYSKIGFEIKIGDKEAKQVGSKIVYKELYAVGNAGAEGAVTLTYTPYDNFNQQSNYFKTYTIYNVPSSAYDTDFTVRAYWVTQDGTTVYGDCVTKSVQEAIKVYSE